MTMPNSPTPDLQLIDDQPIINSTSPVPQLSKSRTIIRMLTTKLATRNAQTPPVVTNAYSKEQRDAALRERGLLPPLSMSQQEAIQDQAIPVVSLVHTRDPSQPSAADLIKKEWENKNKTPSDIERERMQGFKFGATSSTSTSDNLAKSGSSISQHRRGASSDIGHGSFSTRVPLPPSPSPHPVSRSVSPIPNSKRRNTTASSPSPAPSRRSSPPPPPKFPLPAIPTPNSAPVTIHSRASPEMPPSNTKHYHSPSSSAQQHQFSSSSTKPITLPPATTARPSLPEIPRSAISSDVQNPNGDTAPVIELTPPYQPPARRSTTHTPSASRGPSRATSPLPHTPPQYSNASPPGTPSRPRSGSTSAPKRTLAHNPNEDSFSSIMEKSLEAVFAGMSGTRSRSGSRSAADPTKSRNPSRSTSPTPVPTPRPIQSPADRNHFLNQSQSILVPPTATDITASTPIPTSSFLQAHNRTPTNTTSISDTLSSSPPPSLFSNTKLSSPAARGISASGSSTATSDALTADTSAESSPNLPIKIHIRPHTPSKSQPPVEEQDPLDTPPPNPIKNMKFNPTLPKGKLGALSVKTRDGKPVTPDVIISGGPVGEPFTVFNSGAMSDAELLSPKSGARSSDDLGGMSSFEGHMSDEDEGGLSDIKSQSAHTEGHLMMGGKGKRGAALKRGLTDAFGAGSKFGSSVSASGHGSNVRNVSGGPTSPLPAKSGWMSSVKRSVVGTLVRRGDKEKERKDESEKRGRKANGFDAGHLPPSPPPDAIPDEVGRLNDANTNAAPSMKPTTRSRTLSPSSPPPAPSSFWSRAPTTRSTSRAQPLSPPTSPRGFSYYGAGAGGGNTTPASPRKAVSPVVYNAGDISKHASAIEDEETRRMTELAFMG